MSFLLLIVGLLLLLAGGTALVSGASGIARHYGVSPLVVGLTVVAFGTSAPELVINVVGALRGESDLAFGNVAGSNLANLGLILGIAAVVKPLSIQGQIVHRELPLLLLGTSILLVLMLDQPLQGTNPILSRSDGLVLLLLFSIFIYVTVSDFLTADQDALIDNMQEMEESLPSPAARQISTQCLYIAAGIGGLGLGGHMTIVYGAELAESLGVSALVIGLLVVAVGTSLPEMVTSIIAVARNESDLCVGNVIGSNIFNSLVVLPISALLRPLPIPAGGLMDIFLCLAFAAAIVLVFFLGKARMDRKTGLFFIIIYIGYMTQRVMLS